MVVDDDADNRKLLEIRLSQIGHTVISVSSADDALEAVRLYGVPDLVVLDIVMQGASGLDLLRRFRDDPASREMPVLLLTARDLEEDDQVARELHAHLMKKPIETAILTRTLDRVLGTPA
nr:response regulator [Kineosporia mesophila]